MSGEIIGIDYCVRCRNDTDTTNGYTGSSSSSSSNNISQARFATISLGNFAMAMMELEHVNNDVSAIYTGTNMTFLGGVFNIVDPKHGCTKEAFLQQDLTLSVEIHESRSAQCHVSYKVGTKVP
jgi:hypothetical protein